MTYQLVYISSARVDDLVSEVDQILTSSRRNNGAKSVTGVLLYAQGMFFQVLEGEKSVVEQVYSNIEHDSRHSDITSLLEQEVPKPRFADWAMGWSRVPDNHPAAEQLARLGRPDAYCVTEKASMVDTLIESFFQLNRV